MHVADVENPPPVLNVQLAIESNIALRNVVPRMQHLQLVRKLLRPIRFFLFDVTLFRGDVLSLLVS